MAERHEPLIAWGVAAILVAALGAGLFPVLSYATASGISTLLSDPYLWRVLRFTLVQAGVSTLLSLALAIPVALGLSGTAHTRWGRLARAALVVPLGLPPIVVILGIVDVFGNQGWLGGWFELYGLTGILLAHVYFNLPLAARAYLMRLDGIPVEAVRLAQSLGFNRMERFRHLTWPALRASIPAVGALILLLCTSSFAVVLTLGGGPSSTTLEVGLYQALRFDYDPVRAAALALFQLLVCLAIAITSRALVRESAGWPALRARGANTSALAPSAFARISTLMAGLFLLLPLLALALSGLTGTWMVPPMLASLGVSSAIALPAALIATFSAVALAYGVVRSRAGRAFSLLGLAGLIVPPAVLATGWFIMALSAGVLHKAAFGLILFLNALMALPFALTTIAPALVVTRASHDRLCASLGIRGWNRLWRIDLAAIRPVLQAAFGLALVLSLGDLTAISLLGSGEFQTLPSLVYAQMSSYNQGAAASTALVLMGLTACVLFVLERNSHEQS